MTSDPVTVADFYAQTWFTKPQYAAKAPQYAIDFSKDQFLCGVPPKQPTDMKSALFHVIPRFRFISVEIRSRKKNYLCVINKNTKSDLFFITPPLIIKIS
jgi:hypothetical protein